MGHSPVSTAYLWLLNDLLCCNEGFSELQTPKGTWRLAIVQGPDQIWRHQTAQEGPKHLACLVLLGASELCSRQRKDGGVSENRGCLAFTAPPTSEFISHVSVVDRLGEGLFS